VGIGFQVIQPIRIPDTMIKNELMSIRADGERGWGGWKVPLPVVFLQDVIPPRDAFSSHQR